MKIYYLPMLAFLLISSLAASAQTPAIVGTWVLSRAEKLFPDGTRSSDYGEDPHGAGREYLKGLLEISGVQAGLYTAAFLGNGMTSREAEAAAEVRRIETRALDRFTLRRKDPKVCSSVLLPMLKERFGKGLTQLAVALGE
jgi:hypothetical protein